jgi:predicted DNA-binding transcriptional regulator AlpA
MALPRLVNKDDVLALCDVSVVTLWSWMKRGEFPLPLELGPPGGRTTKLRWREDAVMAWLESRPERRYPQASRANDRYTKPRVRPAKTPKAARRQSAHR